MHITRAGGTGYIMADRDSILFKDVGFRGCNEGVCGYASFKRMENGACAGGSVEFGVILFTSAPSLHFTYHMPLSL